MKRKFSLFLNVAVLALCVCAIAIGVYSAKQASLNVSGTIGFEAHDCDVNVSGYIYGHAESVDGPLIPEAEKVTLTSTEIRGEDASMPLGGIFFTDLTDSGEVEPITIVLTITNMSKFAVLLEDTTTVDDDASYSIVCSNSLNVLYIDTEDEKTTTLKYTLKLKKGEDGNYTNLTPSVSVSIGIKFSKIDKDLVGDVADGWQITTEEWTGTYLTGAPSRENYGSDLLIVPSRIKKEDGSIVNINLIQNTNDTFKAYSKIVLLKGYEMLGISALKDCSNLVSICIPSTCASTHYSALENCTSLKSLYIPKGFTGFSSPSLSGCTGLESIVVDEKNTTFYSPDNCNAVIEKSNNSLALVCKNTVIPSSFTSIPDEFFSYYENSSSLTSITIPTGITSFDTSFQDFSSFSKVYFEDVKHTWKVERKEYSSSSSFEYVLVESNFNVSDPVNNKNYLSNGYKWTKNS